MDKVEKKSGHAYVTQDDLVAHAEERGWKVTRDGKMPPGKWREMRLDIFTGKFSPAGEVEITPLS